MRLTLRALADEFGLRLEGQGDVTVTSVAPLERAGDGDVAFCAGRHYIELLKTTRAAAVVLDEQMAKAYSGSKLVSHNPHADFARIAARLHPPPEAARRIDPSASVAASARVAPTAAVGAYCVIGEGAVIEQDAILGPLCMVGDNVHIGAATRLVAAVTVLRGCRIGQRGILHAGVVIGSDGFGFARDGEQWVKVPQLGGVVIGDDVEIGANTTIDRGALNDTVIGNGVKIDNQVQIAHNVKVGDHTVIAGCAGIAGSAVIGRGCAIGGGVGILGHLRIADGVQISATSLVTESIEQQGMYASHLPARPVGDWRRTLVRLQQLDALIRRLERLERELGQRKEERDA